MTHLTFVIPSAADMLGAVAAFLRGVKEGGCVLDAVIQMVPL